MYIINKYGVFTDIPEGTPLPAGARQATAAEVSDWQAKDAAGKARLRQQKLEAAQRKAQLVIVNNAPDVSEPKGKKADDK